MGLLLTPPRSVATRGCPHCGGPVGRLTQHPAGADGYREGTKSVRRCVYRKQLDLETLVCTRGPNFPLSRLEPRLMCPACGTRSVTVVFEPPSNRQVGSG
jgi:endogenous inhibitor of DNA gyrase (YacG/DUF329 family)